MLWCLHFVDVTRVHLTSMRVVSFSNLRPIAMLRAGVQLHRISESLVFRAYVRITIGHAIGVQSHFAEDDDV